MQSGSRATKVEVGPIEVAALRDGEFNIPAEALVNLSEADARALEEGDGGGLNLSNINAYLVRSGDRNLLVDTGCRDLFGPECGFLLEALGEVGLAPEDITDLFLTHMHPDHMAGAVAPDGSPVFVNAALQLVEAEHAFWTSGDLGEAEVNGRGWAELAKTVAAAYGERLELVQPGGEIVPGVASVGIPGHTPGHSGFRVDSGKESLVHLGDIVHVQNLQLVDPRVSTVFDVDPEAALASRKRMLDMVSADGSLCTSGHILAPKFGHVESAGQGFRFTV